jgi:hypothetical protein
MVEVEDDPRRRSLKDRQLRHPVLDARHDLDRRGAGAEHGDAPTGQVVVVVPAGGVEAGPAEALEPGELGYAGLAQEAGGGH